MFITMMLLTDIEKVEDPTMEFYRIFYKKVFFVFITIYYITGVAKISSIGDW